MSLQGFSACMKKLLRKSYEQKKSSSKVFLFSLLFFPIIGPFSELNPKGNSKTIVEIVELTNKKMEHFFNGFYFSIIFSAMQTFENCISK